MTDKNDNNTKPSLVTRLTDKAMAWWNYVSDGVWRDTRSNWKVNTVKTLNLTIKSFLDTDLQSTACAMTYRTLLAIVPALAMVFAIGRGFGFQNILQEQLFKMFPSQHQALQMAMRFIDSCLAQASEGLFVGIGLAFLIWTVISLLGNVEDSFNHIWNITDGRSIFRKMTDYLAICIILPILMICSGGLQIFMSTTIQRILPFHFMTPVLEVVFDAASWVFGWLFFTGAYMLIPNTRVKFKNAFVAGVLAGSSFQILQWLFATGQLYVAKYNAIYGTFSFLPLMLIWLQLSWLITLTGALICYSSQNVFRFSFEDEISTISIDYRRRVALAMMTVIVQRFELKFPPLTVQRFSDIYHVPPRLCEIIASDLLKAGLITREYNSPDEDAHPMLPSMGLDNYTVSGVIIALRNSGASAFVQAFDGEFKQIDDICNDIDKQFALTDDHILLKDIKLQNIQS
ncbi:MAG: YihY/virulence factor BrkB family protein [Lachnoclostridium sp.]|nr:YihY/virulence factor BrkB family protein [Lachnoclostridium sp.]